MIGRLLARWACEGEPFRRPRFRALWAQWILSGCPDIGMPWRSLDDIRKEHLK